MTRFRRRTFSVDAWQNCSEQIPDWVAQSVNMRDSNATLWIDTPECVLPAKWGDWILRDDDGNVYPCVATVFANLYEPERRRSNARLSRSTVGMKVGAESTIT